MNFLPQHSWHIQQQNASPASFHPLKLRLITKLAEKQQGHVDLHTEGVRPLFGD